MIFAEKLVQLRKKAGWSQEELAEQQSIKEAESVIEIICNWVCSWYWPIITIIYFGYSLLTNNWQYSWLIWLIASAILPLIHRFR